MARNNMVSAVIPTRNRPDLVLRAVRSALGQTYQDMEVIVVIDGPDEATSKVLMALDDPRLRVIELPESHGGANARNVGVEAARGDWIALLDDDDEWLPEKTELQMSEAQRSRYKYPIVGSQLFFRTPEYELVWPRRQPYEPISEYLLARNSFSMGEGLLSTITLFFPRELFSYASFTPGLKRCQEVDWVLHARRCDGVGIEFVSQPLAIAHQAGHWESISSVPDWRASLAWVESVRPIITARAYASYVAVAVASQAARQGDRRAALYLLKLVLRNGAPSARDIALFFSVWCVPRRLKLLVRKAGL